MLIAPDLLWVDGALRQGRAVELEAGHVVRVGTAGAARPDLAPHLLIPGPTDLQVNGGGGAMLNDAPAPETLARIAAAHHRRGTGEVMATLITDAPDILDRTVEAMLAARGTPGLLGLHLEGPAIAPERRGTHAARHIRPLDGHLIGAVRRLRRAGWPVMVTLAPERADPARLAELAATGAVISAGHSAADAEAFRAALSRGVRCVTHLYNAMAQMQSRAPGLLGAAILSQAHCGIIADGHHVAPEMLRLALAARPRPDRTFLVSDAMATVGGPDRFTLYGQEITLSGGRLINAEGNLAGAHLDMVTALANIHRLAGAPLDRAVAMATDIPRAALGLPPVAIAAGLPLHRLTALDAELRHLPLPGRDRPYTSG